MELILKSVLISFFFMSFLQFFLCLFSYFFLCFQYSLVPNCHWQGFITLGLHISLSSRIRYASSLPHLSVLFLPLLASCIGNQCPHVNDGHHAPLEALSISCPFPLAPPPLSTSGFQNYTELLRLRVSLLPKLFLTFSFEANTIGTHHRFSLFVFDSIYHKYFQFLLLDSD